MSVLVGTRPAFCHVSTHHAEMLSRMTILASSNDLTLPGVMGRSYSATLVVTSHRLRCPSEVMLSWDVSTVADTLS